MASGQELLAGLVSPRLGEPLAWCLKQYRGYADFQVVFFPSRWLLATWKPPSWYQMSSWQMEWLQDGSHSRPVQ